MDTPWIFLISVLVSILIVAPGEGLSSTCGMHANKGNDFVFGLPYVRTYTADYFRYHKYFLYISANTTGRVYIDAPIANFHKVEHVQEGGTKIALPYSILQSKDQTRENRGIHLHSDIAISASLIITAGHSYQIGGVEGLHLLPTSEHSQDFVVASGNGKQSSILIVASQNLTIITLTFPKTTGWNPQHIVLEATQTYTFFYAGDLSNTRIHSDKPITVISSQDQASLPASLASADSIASVIPANTYGGFNFIVPALPHRSHYIVRVFATEDSTSVTLRNSSSQSHTSLYTDLFDEYMFGDDAVIIEADKPIMVYQYGLGYGFNGENYGPLMRNIPAVENYVSDVSFIIQDGIPEISNYIQVIVPHSSIVMMDSLPLGLNMGSGSLARDYTVGGQRYSVFSLIVPESVDTAHGLKGYHRIFSQYGDVRFAALLTGFKTGRHEAYGLALGMQSSDCHTNTGVVSTTAPVGHGSVTNSSSETALSSLCFNCDDMIKPYICDTFTKCGPPVSSNQQMCYLEKYTTSSNQPRFRSGCRAENLCPAKKRQAPEIASVKVNGHSRDTRSSADKCTECCGKGLCNLDGCGERVNLTANHILMCMSCQHATSLEECTTVVPCSPNEVCHIEGVDYGIYKHYKLGCKPAGECQAEGKKRQAGIRRRRGIPLCNYCCNQNFCNYECDLKQSPAVIIG